MEITRQSIREWSRSGSSLAFGATALELAQEDPDIMLLTADLSSYSGWDDAGSSLSGQYFNVGIAEQDLLGIACGMAKEGAVPFATSYATFSTGRCFDQIRIGMGYMGLPVKLVGMAAGFSIGVLGATHMALDDITLMRAIPGITILSPADCLETIKATRAAAAINGPVYLRLTGGLPNSPVYKEDYSFEPGKAIVLELGTDVNLIATGSMVHESIRAARRLREMGVSTGVLDMHTIEPIDADAIDIASQASLVVTVEEHYGSGGLGSAVLEHLNASGMPSQLLRLGAPKKFYHASNYQELLEEAGLTADRIASRILGKIEAR